MSQNRDYHVYLAKLAEQAERYEDMYMAMKNAASFRPDLTAEERNLLSVAYTHLLDARIKSWRALSSIEQNVPNGNDTQVQSGIALRIKTENELGTLYYEILTLFDQQLIPNASSSESKVFYHKMIGALHLRLANSGPDIHRLWPDSAADALHDYSLAYDLSTTEFPPPHPIRLGLALEIAALHDRILQQPAYAIRIAKQAFDDAIAELDTLSPEHFDDLALYMSLLALLDIARHDPVLPSTTLPAIIRSRLVNAIRFIAASPREIDLVHVIAQIAQLLWSLPSFESLTYVTQSRLIACVSRCLEVYVSFDHLCQGTSISVERLLFGATARAVGNGRVLSDSWSSPSTTILSVD